MLDEINVDAAREQAELEAYLGDAYDHQRLVHYEAQLEAEFRDVGDEQRLYRTSEGYLYNLTAFAMGPTKEPYRAWIARAVKLGGRVADVGCGIGSDGLALAAAGYRVTFADFDNPSTRYLRWRMQRRGLSGEVVDLDSAEIPPGHDLAFAFDVIEHVPDPLALLRSMEASAALVLVNLLEPEPGETALHHELDIDGLLDHAAGMGIVRYRVFHGRSHLVLYHGTRASAAARLRGQGLRHAGGLHRRARTFSAR